MRISHLVVIIYQVGSGSGAAAQRATYRIEQAERDHALIEAGMRLHGYLREIGWATGTVVKLVDISADVLTTLDWDDINASVPGSHDEAIPQSARPDRRPSLDMAE